ncbi:MAG: hypothetical protein E6G97_18470 [Alphaproteobacteria bacterium]|nr:MAG: hypothetical protein E6G97_18470 [Alphaproteobacteria bacterium]
MKTEITVDADLELVRGAFPGGAYAQARQAILDKRCCKVVIKKLGEGVWEATFQGTGVDGEEDLVVWLDRLPEKVLALFAEPVQIDYRDELKKMVEEAKCQAEAEARLMEAMATGAFPPYPVIMPLLPASYREEVKKILAEQKRDPAAWTKVLPTDIEMRPGRSTELLQLAETAETYAQHLLGMGGDQRSIELRKLQQSDSVLYSYVVERLDTWRRAATGLQNVPGADPKDETLQSVRVDESANYLLPGERAFLVPRSVVAQFLNCPCDRCRRFLSCLADVAAVAIKEDYCRVSIRCIGVKSTNWIGATSSFGEAMFELRDMPPAIRALWDRPVTVSAADGYYRLFEGEVVPGKGAFVHAAWLSAILAVSPPELVLGRPFRPIVCDGPGQWYYLSDDGSKHPFSLAAAFKARAIFVKT